MPAFQKAGVRRQPDRGLAPVRRHPDRAQHGLGDEKQLPDDQGAQINEVLIFPRHRIFKNIYFVFYLSV